MLTVELLKASPIVFVCEGKREQRKDEISVVLCTFGSKLMNHFAPSDRV